MKKYLPQLNKNDFFVICLLIGFYWLTRLLNLTLVPMFTDEAIYIRWSQVGSYDAAWRFIPLTDGKPPLFHWFVMVTIRFFSDPLIAGRVVSVAAGFVSLILIWLLSFTLFTHKTIAHLSAFFYLISPMMFVYDRLAIVDALLTTTSIICLWLAVLLVKNLRLDLALLLGGAVGTALLTKATGLIFFLLIPLTLLLCPEPYTLKSLRQFFIKWTGLMILVTFLSQGIYAILRLSQFFYRIEQKNYEFIIPFSEFLKHPFAMAWGNAKSMFAWQVEYLTIPITFLIIISFFDKRFIKEKLLLSGYYLVPFIMIASFNKIIFPRFLLFSTPWLIILAAYGFTVFTRSIRSPRYQLLTLFLISLVALKASFYWLTDPVKAAIPQADKNQYYQGIPSGHGVNQIIDILKQAASHQSIFVGTDGTFGLTPDAFDVYLRDYPQIQIRGYYPVDTIPQEVIEMAKLKPAYFIYFNVQDIPPQDNIELVGEYAKIAPDRTTYLRIYKVHPLLNK